MKKSGLSGFRELNSELHSDTNESSEGRTDSTVGTLNDDAEKQNNGTIYCVDFYYVLELVNSQ